MSSITSSCGLKAAAEDHVKLFSSSFFFPPVGFPSLFLAHQHQISDQRTKPLFGARWFSAAAIPAGRAFAGTDGTASLCAMGEAICAISSEKHAQMCPRAIATGLNPLQPAPRKEGKPLRKRERRRLGCANGDIEDSLMHKHFCWINALTYSRAGWITPPMFCQGVNKILKWRNCLFSGNGVSWSHLGGSPWCHHRHPAPGRGW